MTRTAEFLSIVQAVADDPLGMRPIAADWLDDHIEPERPSVYHAHRVPGWFRRNWLPNHRPKYHEQNRSVVRELEQFADSRLLDHWGVIRVLGVSVLVSEPYAFPDTPEVAGLLDAVAAKVDGVGLFARRSSYGLPPACRLLWLPNPSRLADALRGRGNATFGY